MIIVGQINLMIIVGYINLMIKVGYINLMVIVGYINSSTTNTRCMLFTFTGSTVLTHMYSTAGCTSLLNFHRRQC